MFRTVPLSIIRSFSLYPQQWCMPYKFADSEQDQDGTAVPSWFRSLAVSKPVWHIPLLWVQWKAPDDGPRNCPKHVEFYSKNKFEKLVHLVGFIIRIYHDARSPESHIRNIYCHKTVNLKNRFYYTLYSTNYVTTFQKHTVCKQEPQWSPWRWSNKHRNK